LKVDFLDILLFVLFFQILSLVPFLLFQNEKIGYTTKFLALFLIAKAVCITNIISSRNFDTFYDIFPHIFYVGSSFTILWGPLLYFYTKSLSYTEFRLNKTSFLHFIPFLIHIGYLSIIFHFHGAETKRELLDANNLFPNGYFTYYIFYVHLSNIIYTLLAFSVLKKYKKIIAENFSSTTKKNLNWMTFVLLGFSAKIISDIVCSLDSRFSDNEAIVTLTISRIVLYLFINIMIFKGFKYKNIFAGIDVDDDQNSKKVSLSGSAMEKYSKILTEFMETEKPYLIPELSLSQLSEKVSIPQRSLSEVLNDGIGQNFYEFINEYRIKESVTLLTDSAHYDKNILEILYSVGFNSKSSFNKSFKKNTGFTPVQFRELNKNQKKTFQYN